MPAEIPAAACARWRRAAQRERARLRRRFRTGVDWPASEGDRSLRASGWRGRACQGFS